MFPGMMGGPRTIALNTALPTLSTDITISPGANNITVTRAGGAADFRIFRVNAGATCTINGLKITGGSEPGTAPFGGLGAGHSRCLAPVIR